MSSARTDILGRYTKFFLSLRDIACCEVRVQANLAATDLRTTTRGRNLRAVKNASGMDPLRSRCSAVKTAIASREMVDLLPQDKWRIKYLWTLLGRVQVYGKVVQA